MSDKQTDILNRKGEENAVSKSEIVHNASDETFNPDAVEKTDFPEIDGGEYYYYRPTEVRARLKVLRSAAQDKGYIDEKKSGHINKWIPKIQGNEEVDKAYDDLKTKVKMSDDDINSLINKFSYKQNDQPQLNNIVWRRKENNGVIIILVAIIIGSLRVRRGGSRKNGLKIK